MSIINVLVGLPGSGKDYFARKAANEATDVIISSDDIRAELYGSAECQDNPSRVFEEMFKRTCAAVHEGKQMVYYNATNLSRKRRMNLIKEFKRSLGEVSVIATIVLAPFDLCLERNSLRDRVVPREVMERMYKQFTVPSCYEGFDQVDVELNYMIGEKESIINQLINARTVSQDNPHHTFSVGDHCLAARDYVIDHKEEILRDMHGSDDWFKYITSAATYHDIGKPFCKTFKNGKGEETEIAHFYQHENVGAYDYLANVSGKDSKIVALLINLHMIFYADSKYQERMKELYKGELWTALEWLHKADQAAH
jgi:predicted kinase